MVYKHITIEKVKFACIENVKCFKQLPPLGTSATVGDLIPHSFCPKMQEWLAPGRISRNDAVGAKLLSEHAAWLNYPHGSETI